MGGQKHREHFRRAFSEVATKICRDNLTVCTGFRILTTRVTVKSCDMAKDPFSNPSTANRRFPLGRIAIGLLIAACATLAFGFYGPLSSAHAVLASEHESLNQTQSDTEQQLKTTTDQLLETKKERDELAAAMKTVEQERSDRKAKVDDIGKAVESKLASSIKAKVVVVEPTDDGVTLVIDDSRLFRSTEATLHRPGTRLLCAVAKALKGLEVDFKVAAHSQASKVTDTRLRRDYPTTWELTAAKAASATRLLVQCGLPAKSTAALGLGHSRPNPDADKKSLGELRLVLTHKN